LSIEIVSIDENFRLDTIRSENWPMRGYDVVLTDPIEDIFHEKHF
jgi:hypothetical protein